MKNFYSIIIPIYNEEHKIPDLLQNLKSYSNDGHEIIIIDDGSKDNSFKILSKSKFVNLHRFDQNQGKGVALKKGLSKAKNSMIVIYDGDLELHPNQIQKLMILDKKNHIDCVFASRYVAIDPLQSYWDFGNLLLTRVFNWVNKTNTKDALCCAKSFYKSDLMIDNLVSKKFDIDVEIFSQLIDRTNKFQSVNINYNRRKRNDGKKLGLKDSFLILKRILMNPSKV